MIPPADAFEAGLRIAAALERHGVSYALGGALAYGQYGIPRATNDVDVNVFVDPPSLAPVVAALRSLGIDVDEDAARTQAEAEGLFIVWFADLRVDVFTPSIAFAWEAERTRVQSTVEGTSGAAGTAAGENVVAVRLAASEALRPIQLAQRAVERAERQMPRLAGHLEDQAVRETQRRSSPKVLEGHSHDFRVLQCQTLMLEQHLDRGGDLARLPLVDHREDPHRLDQHQMAHPRSRRHERLGRGNLLRVIAGRQTNQHVGIKSAHPAP